jgi:hypothetical protein
LLIPLIRFGPRYVTLAADLVQGRPHQWADLAMERDSREAARHVAGSVFVWGYRPEIYVMAKQPAATMFLDSQPLTGVLADRHLTSAVPTAPNLAAQNRAKLIQTNPDWIVDGLGPYNPKLAITEFVDLREWLSQYEAVHKTGGAVIYRRRP